MAWSAQSLRVRKQFLTVSFAWNFVHAFHLMAIIFTLSYSKGGFALAIWAFVVEQFFEAFGEVATGQFADYVSRKLSVFLGMVLMGLGGTALLVATISPDLLGAYALVTVGQFCYMGGLTFVSGAMEAWAIDSINFYEKKRQDFAALFTADNVMMSAGLASGGAVTLALMLLTDVLWLPWLVIAIGGTLLSVFVWVSFEEPYPRTRGELDLISHAKEMLSVSFGEPNVRRFTLAFAVQCAMTLIVASFWIRLMADFLSEWNSKSLTTVVLGFWIVVSFLRLLSSRWIERVILRTPQALNRWLLSLSTILPLPYFFLGLAFSLGLFQDSATFGLVFLTFYLFAKQVEVACHPLRRSKINEAIADPKHRAACLSMSVCCGALMVVFNFFVYRLLVGHFPTSSIEMISLIFLSSIVALTAPVLYRRALRSESTNAVSLGKHPALDG